VIVARVGLSAAGMRGRFPCAVSCARTPALGAFLKGPLSPRCTRMPGESRQDSPGFTPDTLEGLAPQGRGGSNPPFRTIRLGRSDSYDKLAPSLMVGRWSTQMPQCLCRVPSGRPSRMVRPERRRAKQRQFMSRRESKGAPRLPPAVSPSVSDEERNSHGHAIETGWRS
jgi:hypothetical protein